jgi:nucleotide-binding universal stress UspA family protein
MFHRKVILHATDFSPQSAYAFEVARRLARESGSSLDVLHVLPAVFDKSRNARERRLFEWAASDRSVKMSPILLVGDPAEKILWCAEEFRCDLIVLGSRGRTPFQSLWSRSVTRQLESRAPCPVLSFCAPQAWLDTQAHVEEGSLIAPAPEPFTWSPETARRHGFPDERFTVAEPRRFQNTNALATSASASLGRRDGL